MPSVLRTLEQERAKYAWDCVVQCPDKQKYGSIVEKLSSYILTNGLGQTLAFLKAKGKNDPSSEHEILYRHLEGWLKKQLQINGDLLEWIVKQATSQQYRLATMEVLAFLQWLQRFVEAQLPKREK